MSPIDENLAEAVGQLSGSRRDAPNNAKSGGGAKARISLATAESGRSSVIGGDETGKHFGFSKTGGRKWFPLNGSTIKCLPPHHVEVARS